MSNRFKEFALPNLISEEEILVLDQQEGILTLLQISPQVSIREQQRLAPSELFIFSSLLTQYPDYCPYEVMLSSVTGKSIERCRKDILDAINEGYLDAVLHPIRNLLGRCRLRSSPFGIQIKSILETGYVLVPSKRLVTGTAEAHKEEAHH